MEILRCRPVKDFHELKVWQKAHQLTVAVYRITAAFPREELYGLTSQLRRACSSIAANLAEGQRVGISPVAGQRSEADQASCYKELGQGTIELKRMLTALMQKLNADG
jgi:hypothetical protein